MKKLADISSFESLVGFNGSVFNTKRHSVKNTVWDYKPLNWESTDPKYAEKQIKLAKAKKKINELAVLAKGLGFSTLELVRLLAGYGGLFTGHLARGLGQGAAYASKGLGQLGKHMLSESDQILQDDRYAQGIRQAHAQRSLERFKGNMAIQDAEQLKAKINRPENWR